MRDYDRNERRKYRPLSQARGAATNSLTNEDNVSVSIEPRIDTDPIRLELHPSFHDPQCLDIEVYSERASVLGDELSDMLRDQDLENEGAVRFANSLTHVVVTGISAAGGLAGIATVLRAFFHRHNGKKIEVKTDGETTQINISGFSLEDAKQLVEKALNSRKDDEP